MSTVGKYVQTFAEASHALPEGMHMNADYPFMLPPIVKLAGSSVTLRGSGGQELTAKIVRKKGRECCVIEQTSTFERLYNRPPQRFTCWPFKDEQTPAIASGELGLFPSPPARSQP